MRHNYHLQAWAQLEASRDPGVGWSSLKAAVSELSDWRKESPSIWGWSPEQLRLTVTPRQGSQMCCCRQWSPGTVALTKSKYFEKHFLPLH